jgi:hypothetical protein
MLYLPFYPHFCSSTILLLDIDTPPNHKYTHYRPPPTQFDALNTNTKLTFAYCTTEKSYNHTCVFSVFRHPCLWPHPVESRPLQVWSPEIQSYVKHDGEHESAVKYGDIMCPSRVIPSCIDILWFSHCFSHPFQSVSDT